MAITTNTTDIIISGTEENIENFNGLAGVVFSKKTLNGIDIVDVRTSKRLVFSENSHLKLAKDATRMERMIFNHDVPDRAIQMTNANSHLETGYSATIGNAPLTYDLSNPSGDSQLIFEKTTSSHSLGGAIFVNNPTAKITLKGRLFSYGSLPIRFDDGIFIARNGDIFVSKKCANNEYSIIMIRNAELDIIGLKLNGEISFIKEEQTLVTLTNLKGLDCIGSFGVGSNVGAKIFYLEYVKGTGEKATYVGWGLPGQSRIVSKNPISGSNFYHRGYNDVPHANNRLHVETTQRFRLNAFDVSGNAVEGAKYYIKDTDNGKRGIINSIDSTTGAVISVNKNYLSLVDGVRVGDNRVYSKVTDENGKTEVVDIITAIAGSIQQIRNPAPYERGCQVDVRGLEDLGYGFNRDEFKVAVISYPHQIQIRQKHSMITGDESYASELEMTLLQDTLITETNKSVVDAYTEIDTVEKLYDRAKSYLVDEYEGEEILYLSITDGTAYLGNLNIIIDKTATEVFEINEDGDIVIKADTFTGNIETSGFVQLDNGAVFDGTILDINGDSLIEFSADTLSWEYYNTVANALTGENLQASGDATEKRMRFMYVPNKLIVLRIQSANEYRIVSITPTGAGIITIESDVLGSVNSVISKVDALDTKADEIKTITEELNTKADEAETKITLTANNTQPSQ